MLADGTGRGDLGFLRNFQDQFDDLCFATVALCRLTKNIVVVLLRLESARIKSVFRTVTFSAVQVYVARRKTGRIGLQKTAEGGAVHGFSWVWSSTNCS